MISESSRMHRYIDIGANLLDPMFKGIYRGSVKHSPDLDAVLQRAETNGLRSIIITGTDLVASRRALHLCRTVNASHRFAHLRLYSTVGLHPLSTMQLEFDSKHGKMHQDMTMKRFLNLALKTKKNISAHFEM